MSGDGYNFQKLKEEILSRSVAKNWNDARDEWKLIDIYQAEEAETCLCEHFPIIDICVLENIRNQQIAEVGNVCVKKFMHIDSSKIFDSIKRIREDNDKAPNRETIALFYEQKLISKWELDFSLDTWRKRVLTNKQMRIRREINQKILQRMTRVRI